jgi:hypothetical protein
MTPGQNSAAAPHQVLPGQVFSIPRNKRGNAVRMGLKDSAYNHPCVILSTIPIHNKYAALIVSDSRINKLSVPDTDNAP